MSKDTATKITRQEQETIIVFNEAESESTIETYNNSIKRKLESSCNQYPDLFKKLSDRPSGSSVFLIPKKYIRISSPRFVSDEQREAMSKRAKERWSKISGGEENNE